MLATATPEMAVALQDAAIHEDTPRLFAAVNLPTLALHRREDALVSVEEASKRAGAIPGSPSGAPPRELGSGGHSGREWRT